MDYRVLLALLLLPPPIAMAALSLLIVSPHWLGFVGDSMTAIGSAATLLPVAVIAARILRVLPPGGRTNLPALRRFQQRVAARGRAWHYWLLLAGLVMIIAGAIVSTVHSWPATGG